MKIRYIVKDYVTGEIYQDIYSATNNWSAEVEACENYYKLVKAYKDTGIIVVCC